jgi:anti-sigma B factor antagonist
MWKKFNVDAADVKVGDLTVKRINIEGYLDSSTFPKLQEYLSEMLAAGHHFYLMDLRGLDYISSAGLGVLMGMLRDVRDHNGDLKIVNMSEKIERVFNLLGFSRMMKVYGDEASALASFVDDNAMAGEETAQSF